MADMVSKPVRGKFIVIEGLDRAGKTTQAMMFYKSLTPDERMHVGWPIEYPNRHPSSVTGRLIDGMLSGVVATPQEPHAMQALYVANRWEHVASINHLLSRGRHVICTRYSPSGIAYTMAAGGDMEIAIALETGLPVPDRIVFFNVSDNEQKRRMDDEKNVGRAVETTETTDKQSRVRKAFEQLIARPLYVPWTVIDSSSGTPDQVFERWAPEMKRFLFENSHGESNKDKTK